MEARGTTPREVTDPAPMGAPKVYLVHRPGSVQTTLYVGTQALTRTNPDYEPLAVANRVLGGVDGPPVPASARGEGLHIRRRQRLRTSPYVGAWTAQTSVRTEVTEPALRDLLAEIAAMRDKLVPAQEFEDSKRALVAQFALSLESPQRCSATHLESWQYRLPADYWDNYPDAHRGDHARAGPGRGEEVLGSVAPPDRRRRRRVEDPRYSRQVRHGTRSFDSDGKPLIMP